ncbi:MAG: GNAT family N-acetyltransferase [Pseudomonadota bacterium]
MAICFLPLAPLHHAIVSEILYAAFSAGDTYAVPESTSPEDCLAWWTGPSKTVFVAVNGDQVLGTYYIRPNAEGPGSHVCNCGYITDPSARGRGVATAMLTHSLEEAVRQGYRAMQYNAVVSTNTGAIRLWERAGFTTLARVPGAFRHPTEGYVDTLIMFKSLVD